MKKKKYVFELVVRESESLEKICSTMTACDYDFDGLKSRKADGEILNCKDILLDNLPKKELEEKTVTNMMGFLANEGKKIASSFVDEEKEDLRYPAYPNIVSSWDTKKYVEAIGENQYSDCDIDEYGFKYNYDEAKKYAWYHKPTKLWVYFLPNYGKRQVISLGLKHNATLFNEEEIEYFSDFLKKSSFNGTKYYARDNFLEFELRLV
jgi:hypothetical protein